MRPNAERQPNGADHHQIGRPVDHDHTSANIRSRCAARPFGHGSVVHHFGEFDQLPRYATRKYGADRHRQQGTQGRAPAPMRLINGLRAELMAIAHFSMTAGFYRHVLRMLYQFRALTQRLKGKRGYTARAQRWNVRIQAKGRCSLWPCSKYRLDVRGRDAPSLALFAGKSTLMNIWAA